MNIVAIMCMTSFEHGSFKNDLPIWWLFSNIDKIWFSQVSFVADFEGNYYIFHQCELPFKFIMQSSTAVNNLATKSAVHFWIMHIAIFSLNMHSLNYRLNSIELIMFILVLIISTMNTVFATWSLLVYRHTTGFFSSLTGFLLKHKIQLVPNFSANDCKWDGKSVYFFSKSLKTKTKAKNKNQMRTLF